MDELLIIAIEADKKKPHNCAMKSVVGDLQTAVTNIGSTLYGMRGDVKKAIDAAESAAASAEKAASKKTPTQKKSDYVMDVVRGDDGLITRVDVRAV